MKSIKFIILLIIIVNHIFIVHSTYSSPDIYSFKKGTIYSLSEFGFVKDGTFQLNIKGDFDQSKYDNLTTVVAMCQSKYLKYMNNIAPCYYLDPANYFNYDVAEGDPYLPFLDACQSQKFIKDYTGASGVSSFNGTILKTDYYDFISFTCWNYGPNSIDLEISYEQLNPHHNHLSMEFFNYPSTYLAFFIIWSIVAVGWLINWLMFRKQSTKLHFIISLIPISTIIYIIYTYVFYSSYKESGDFGWAVYVFSSLIYSFQLCVFLTVLMLISMGYGIFKRDFKNTSLLLGVLVLILFFSTFVCTFYTMNSLNFILLITYIPVPIFIIYMAQSNINNIKANINKTSDTESTATTTTTTTTTTNSSNFNNNNNSVQERELDLKRNRTVYYLFQGFKWTMVPYCIVLILITIISVYIYSPWVFLLIHLLINLSLFVMIAIIFRLKRVKKDQVYYEFTDEETNNTEMSQKN